MQYNFKIYFLFIFFINVVLNVMPAVALAPTTAFYSKDATLRLHEAIKEKKWAVASIQLELRADPRVLLQYEGKGGRSGSLLFNVVHKYTDSDTSEPDEAPDAHEERLVFGKKLLESLGPDNVLKYQDFFDFHNTPFLAAVSANDTEWIDIFLTYIEDHAEKLKSLLWQENATDLFQAKTTPLLMAIKNGNIALAVRLAKLHKKYGEKNALDFQNTRGNTALMLAAWLRQDKLVEALLDAGADQALKNRKGVDAYELYCIGKEQDYHDFRRTGYLVGDALDSPAELFNSQFWKGEKDFWLGKKYAKSKASVGSDVLKILPKRGAFASATAVLLNPQGGDAALETIWPWPEDEMKEEFQQSGTKSTDRDKLEFLQKWLDLMPQDKYPLLRHKDRALQVCQKFSFYVEEIYFEGLEPLWLRNFESFIQLPDGSRIKILINRHSFANIKALFLDKGYSLSVAGHELSTDSEFRRYFLEFNAQDGLVLKKSSSVQISSALSFAA